MEQIENSENETLSLIIKTKLNGKIWENYLIFFLSV